MSPIGLLIERQIRMKFDALIPSVMFSGVYVKKWFYFYVHTYIQMSFLYNTTVVPTTLNFSKNRIVLVDITSITASFKIVLPTNQYFDQCFSSKIIVITISRGRFRHYSVLLRLSLSSVLLFIVQQFICAFTHFCAYMLLFDMLVSGFD